MIVNVHYLSLNFHVDTIVSDVANILTEFLSLLFILHVYSFPSFLYNSIAALSPFLCSAPGSHDGLLLSQLTSFPQIGLNPQLLPFLLPFWSPVFPLQWLTFLIIPVYHPLSTHWQPLVLPTPTLPWKPFCLPLPSITWWQFFLCKRLPVKWVVQVACFFSPVEISHIERRLGSCTANYSTSIKEFHCYPI